MKRSFSDLPPELRSYWRLFAEQADLLLAPHEREELRRFETGVQGLFADGYDVAADERPVRVVDVAEDAFALLARMPGSPSEDRVRCFPGQYAVGTASTHSTTSDPRRRVPHPRRRAARFGIEGAL